MKKITITTLTALFLSVPVILAQTTAHTKPTGYVTHTLKKGQFNLVGLTLHEPITASGIFETVQSNDNGTPGTSSPEVDDDYSVLTDDEVNFSTTLTAGKTYILEITDAADTSLNGTIQEVTVWSNNTLTTPQDLYAEGLRAGDKYQIRAAVTLQQVFGEVSVLQANGSESSADVIWVPDAGGNFIRYYYRTSLGGGGTWYNATDTVAVSGDIPLVYTDAVMVQMRDASPDVSLVVTGTVKTGGVSIAVYNGFNLVSNVYPVGSTLQNSGLAADLESQGSEAASDIVWLPDGNGDFVRYYYKTALGGAQSWHNASTDSTVSADVPLTSAFFIQRGGTAKNMDLSPPSGYSGL